VHNPVVDAGGVVVRRATADDLDELADVLGQAFADYAWTRWTVDPDDHQARVASLQRLAAAELALPYGQVWLGVDQSSTIVCAALWMSPDADVPLAVQRRVSSLSAELEGRLADQAEDAQHAAAELRPRSPHFYLGSVGTVPSHRRRGIAAAVLAPVLALASAQRTPAYLETSEPGNVRFYETLGFSVLGEADAPGLGGPHIWGMLRPGSAR
jgi:ribosomal protein S18 acetylase RimI-like enzyme